MRLGRLKAKLDTVLGKGKSKTEEDNKGTPVGQPSLEQLREALKKKKKDVLAKKSKPKTSGSTSLLQKLAAKAQASSETPSRT